jgi:excisionase family DNA binding protein
MSRPGLPNPPLRALPRTFEDSVTSTKTAPSLRPDTPAATTVLHDAGAVARRLDVSVRTVRRLIAAGELPVHRIGRAVRVSADDLARFLAARRYG